MASNNIFAVNLGAFEKDPKKKTPSVTTGGEDVVTTPLTPGLFESQMRAIDITGNGSAMHLTYPTPTDIGGGLVGTTTPKTPGLFESQMGGVDTIKNGTLGSYEVPKTTYTPGTVGKTYTPTIDQTPSIDRGNAAPATVTGAPATVTGAPAPGTTIKTYEEFVNGGSTPSSGESSSVSNSGSSTDGSTGGSDVSGSGSTGGTGSDVSKPLTFSEMLEKMRNDSIAQAETTRQRAIVDAESAYQKSKSTYGANAEALASMGLTGSGYGEYLDGKAYAQMRSDVQAAKATAEQTKRDIENNYYQRLMELQEYEENKKNSAAGTFAEILAGASSGAYTSEQIDALAKMFGYSDEEREVLTNAVTNTEKDSISEEISSSGSDYDIDSIIEGVKTGEIEKEEGDKYIAAYNKVVLDDARYIFSSGDETAISATLKNADTLFGEKKITEETYQNIYADYISSKITNATFDTVQSVVDFESELTILQNRGKLSGNKTEEFKSKLYDRIRREHMLDPSLYTTEFKYFNWEATIFGNKYTLEYEPYKLANERTTKIFNEMAGGNPEEGMLSELNGNLFLYSSKLGWVLLKKNEEFYNAYKNACSKQ